MTTKQAVMEREHTEQYLAFKEIVTEIAADTISYYNHHVDERCCVFCDIILFPEDPHKDDCIWIRSRKLVEQCKMEEEYKDRLQNDKDIKASLNGIKE